MHKDSSSQDILHFSGFGRFRLRGQRITPFVCSQMEVSKSAMHLSLRQHAQHQAIPRIHEYQIEYLSCNKNFFVVSQDESFREQITACMRHSYLDISLRSVFFEGPAVSKRKAGLILAGEEPQSKAIFFSSNSIINQLSGTRRSNRRDLW